MKFTGITDNFRSIKKRLACMGLALMMLFLCLNGFSSVASADEASFQASLAQFPESYRASLTALHQAHPNWSFTAEYLGIDWDTALAEESVYGKSLVSSSSVASWKSTMDAAYNASTGTWTGLDGASWVQASVAITEYYMDPRNYLDSTHIYAFLDQNYDSSQASNYTSGLNTMLSGTFMSGNFTDTDGSVKSYASVLNEAGSKSGVNPMVLAAMIIIEQGRDGSGGSISGTVSGYEGYFNYFNVGAYARNGMTAIQRGMWYAKGSGEGATTYNRPWNTRYASIIGGSQYYGSGYVNAGQDNLYYKKFNVTPNSSNAHYTHQYMTNIQAAASEASQLANAYTGNEPLNFVIPVYDNMPASAVAKPTSNIVGDGDYSTSEKVTTAGSTFRVAPATLSTGYTVSSGVMSGISNGTSVSTLLSAVKVSNGSVKVFNASGTRITGSTIVGTGCEVRVYNSAGRTQDTYEIAVRGDVNGDGQISAVDLLRVQKYLLELIEFDDAYAAAGDINEDGRISAIDLLKVQKHLLGVSTIN